MEADISELKTGIATHEERWQQQFRVNRNIAKKVDDHDDQLSESLVIVARMDENLKAIKWLLTAIGTVLIGMFLYRVFGGQGQ